MIRTPHGVGAKTKRSPTPCGVRITWSTRRGDRYVQSFFFTEPPVRDGRTLTGGGQRVTAGSDFALTVERGYSSGTEPRLFRARLSFPAATGRPLGVTVCGG